MSYEVSPIASLAFAMRAKALMNSSDQGKRWLDEVRAPAAAHRMFEASMRKAAVGTGDNIIDLGGAGANIGAWAAALRNRSAMMRILDENGFIRVPLRSRVAVTTQAAVGHSVGEGQAMPLSPISIQYVTLTPVRCASLVVCSNEQLTDLSSGGQAALGRSIADAVSRSIDACFTDMITSTATTSFPASGTAATNAWKDLRQALLAVSASGKGAVYAIASPQTGAMLATLATSDGAQAFSAAPNEVANYPLIISDGAPLNEIIVLNSAQITADATPIVPRGSTEATIEMSDSPTHNATEPVGTSLVSLWQNNATALGCECWVGALPLNDAAVAVITSCDYGA